MSVSLPYRLMRTLGCYPVISKPMAPLYVQQPTLLMNNSFEISILRAPYGRSGEAHRYTNQEKDGNNAMSNVEFEGTCVGCFHALSSAPRSCRYCISFYTRHNSTSVEESANGGAKLNFSFDAQASSLPPKKAKDKGKAPRSPIMIAPASLVHLSDEATIDASAPSRAASLTITLQHLPLLSHQ
ncbi:hypothetical protein V6N13_019798 [Hibiscus sabdariffa]